MTERISDERLADCIEVARQDVEAYAKNAHGRTRIKADTLAALRELAELREQTRWIPVTERLPEDDDYPYRLVLTVHADGSWDTAMTREVQVAVREAQTTGEEGWFKAWREIGPLPGGEG
jgi:hypothetical protein